MSESTQCALWYMRYFQVYYDLCESEEEAATNAVAMQDAGSGSVLGVQFPDGRTVKREDWTAFDDAQTSWDQHWDEVTERTRNAPKVPTRAIRDPFEGKDLTTPIDAPAWLGAP